MSIYLKLNKARIEFHALKLAKTGHNKFAGYKYFELGDFLIPALKVFQQNQLCAFISFNAELATMTIVDIETKEQMLITSPMSTAALKGSHEVQNLGAVQTYLRRYLWIAALEIVEHDAVDASEGKDSKKASENGPISATQGAMERLPAEEQEYLKELAMTVVDIMHNDSPEAANERIKSENLDADQKTALWSILDSKTRSALSKLTKK